MPSSSSSSSLLALLLSAVVWFDKNNKMALVRADVDLPLPMRHPQFPFEPVYLRKYTVSMDEAKSLTMCQSMTHDCDWGLIVLLRQESCIPKDFELVGLMHDQDALNCPLLIEGFSIYDTDNTSPDATPHKHHITNQAGVGLPVFVFNSARYFWWQVDNKRNFTYADLITWADENEDVYRGVAKEFFESMSTNVNPDALDMNNTLLEGHEYEEGDMTVIVKGVLEGDHEFSFTIDEVGDTYRPIIWDVTLTGGDAYSSDDEGLEEGALAGVIIGAAIFGAIVGGLVMLFAMGRGGGGTTTRTTTTTSSRVPASTSSPGDTMAHKDVETTNKEPTESHHDE